MARTVKSSTLKYNADNVTAQSKRKTNRLNATKLEKKTTDVQNSIHIGSIYNAGTTITGHTRSGENAATRKISILGKKREKIQNYTYSEHEEGKLVRSDKVTKVNGKIRRKTTYSEDKEGRIIRDSKELTRLGGKGKRTTTYAQNNDGDVVRKSKTKTSRFSDKEIRNVQYAQDSKDKTVKTRDMKRGLLGSHDYNYAEKNGEMKLTKSKQSNAFRTREDTYHADGAKSTKKTKYGGTLDLKYTVSAEGKKEYQKYKVGDLYSKEQSDADRHGFKKTEKSYLGGLYKKNYEQEFNAKGEAVGARQQTKKSFMGFSTKSEYNSGKEGKMSADTLTVKTTHNPLLGSKSKATKLAIVKDSNGSAQLKQQSVTKYSTLFGAVSWTKTGSMKDLDHSLLKGTKHAAEQNFFGRPQVKTSISPEARLDSVSRNKSFFERAAATFLLGDKQHRTPASLKPNTIEPPKKSYFATPKQSAFDATVRPSPNQEWAAKHATVNAAASPPGLLGEALKAKTLQVPKHDKASISANAPATPRPRKLEDANKKELADTSDLPVAFAPLKSKSISKAAGASKRGAPKQEFELVGSQTIDTIGKNITDLVASLTNDTKSPEQAKAALDPRSRENERELQGRGR